jgi:hypothetical protein
MEPEKIMNKLARQVAAVIAVAALGVSYAGAASAETQWNKDHPRRHEVNHRLGNQNARIHQQVRDGDMTHAQASQLHHDDHQIRTEERDMASQNDGHITKQEQHTLNQQENQVSKQIGQ